MTNKIRKAIGRLDKAFRITLQSVSLNLRLWFEILRHNEIVVIDIDYKGFCPYVMPVVKEIQQRKGIALFISYGNLDVSQAAKLLKIKPAFFYSKKLNRSIVSRVVFVSPDQWATCTLRGLNICMFHGQPSKNTTFIPHLIQNFDVLFFISPLQKQLFEEVQCALGVSFPRLKTYDIGYPKSDSFFNGAYSKQEVLERLNLDANRPTVIYAPSYEEGTSLREYGEEVIQRLVTMDINLLVKLHPLSLAPQDDPAGTGDIDWVKRLAHFDRYPNYRFINDSFADPYLVASDILVTDVSGVALEFMHLDRPIIYLESPLFYAEYLPKLGIDPQRARNNIGGNAGKEAGLSVNGPDELPEAIIRSLHNPMEYSDKRQAIIKLLSYNKGTATRVLVDTLLQLAKEKNIAP